MRQFRLIVPCCAAAIVVVPASVPAQAIPNAAQGSRRESDARAHFTRGVSLAQSGDYAAALSEFESAYALSGRANILYNIAVTQEALHRDADAARSLERYLRDADLTPARRAETERALAQIRERLGEVRLLGAPPGASVLVDGQRVATTPLAEPLRIAPGEHLVEVRAQGYEGVQQLVIVSAGQAREVRIVPVAATSVGPRAASTTLQVTANAPGVSVQIDGRAAQVSAPVPVSPGVHSVRVSAPGRASWQGRVRVEPGSARVVRVQLGERRGWGFVPLAIAGGATLLFGTAALITGVNTLTTHDEFESLNPNDPRAEDVAARGVALRTATNVLLGATLISGIVSVVFFTQTGLVVPRAQVDVALTPRPEGGAEGGLRVRF